MNQIPAIFWMVIISIVTLCICVLIYYLAMSAKELSFSIRNMNTSMSTLNKILEKVNGIVSKAEIKVDMLLNTVDALNDTINIPIQFVKGFINKINKDIN